MKDYYIILDLPGKDLEGKSILGPKFQCQYRQKTWSDELNISHPKP